MKKLGLLLVPIFLASLFLTIGHSGVENEKAIVNEKAPCLESQYEVRVDSGEITCAENIDLNVAL